MTTIIADINKTFCCVPDCGTAKSKFADSSITFHEFPIGNPKLASKWILKINAATVPKHKPMWFPRQKSVVCSKHFKHHDFDKDSLKPTAHPTVFFGKLVDPDLDKPLSDLKAASTKSPSVGIKTKSDSSSVSSPTPKISVKSSMIKGILNRASVLFERNMAKTKVLEKTLSPSPANENSEVEPIPSNSISLPQLNLDQALSLASLQTKEGNLNEKVKQKKVFGRPRKVNSKTSNLDSSANRSTSDLVENKSANVPKMGMTTSNKIQKKKQESSSKSELIKIGPNKYIKIQRLNAKDTPSTNTVLNSVSNKTSTVLKSVPNETTEGLNSVPKNTSTVLNPVPNETSTVLNSVPNEASTVLNPVPNETSTVLNPVPNETSTKLNSVQNETLINIQSEDEDVAMDCNVDDSYDSSNDYEPTTATEIAIGSNSTVESAIIQSALNKQQVFFAATMPIESQSHAKPLNPGNPKLTKKSSLKQENALLKKVNSKPMLGQSLSKSLNKASQIRLENVFLKKENAQLKKKIAELERRIIAPVVNPCASEKALKKKALLKKVQEQQKLLDEPIQMRLNDIRKEASKGDVYATYLLELIIGFGYAHRKPRFSDSTLVQCAQLCRKNAFAYELFRKEPFLKLPPFSAVERFMRRNPSLSLASKTSPSVPSPDVRKNDAPQPVSGIGYKMPKNVVQKPVETPTADTSTPEMTTFPMTVDTSSSELREIVLETGEVVQCYSSNIFCGADGYQYYILPNDDLNQGQDAGTQNSENTQRIPIQVQETEITTAVEIIS